MALPLVEVLLEAAKATAAFAFTLARATSWAAETTLALVVRATTAATKAALALAVAVRVGSFAAFKRWRNRYGGRLWEWERNCGRRRRWGRGREDGRWAGDRVGEDRRWEGGWVGEGGGRSEAPLTLSLALALAVRVGVGVGS